MFFFCSPQHIDFCSIFGPDDESGSFMQDSLCSGRKNLQKHDKAKAEIWLTDCKSLNFDENY
jgi:hypothetical protein